ncbi:MAG: thioredoxin-disulfide reductase [Lachnospiraceae bacterium]|jgi:thioredoxin reductase (NADPH)|nr:thioredoxin-disulfide reductase [Lachnospiraceae bacterium]
MEKYDLLIIGSGPAGLSAAIYAQRARLNTAVIEKEMMSGGQVLTTMDVDNYPGLMGIGGFELGMKFREHAEQLGAVFIEDEIKELQVQETSAPKGSWKQAVGENGTYLAKTIILASGATHRMLGVSGEERLRGRGVSYCATCDGAFFRNKVTAVVGGGDVALEDAIFLSRMCSKVYVIHRRNELRGAKILQETMEAQENIEVIWDTVVDAIEGDDQVENLKLKSVINGQIRDLQVQGVFIAVGITPNSQAFKGLVAMEDGYIKAEEDCATSVPGIFAAGDVRTKSLRQVVTAAADGANAVTSAERYLARFGREESKVQQRGEQTGRVT